MVGLYDGAEYVSYRDRRHGKYYEAEGCIDGVARAILKRENIGKHIYAHNGGRFDFLFLLPWLMGEGQRLGFTFCIVPTQSSIQVLDVWKEGLEKHGKWRFLDSLRLMPMSLDEAAKTFGFEGKTEHFDLDLHQDDPQWEEYNERDCVQLYKILEKFHSYIEDDLGGEVGITAPSTSMKLFRRKYLQFPIERHTKVHEFVRRAYYGGRVEVFRNEGNHLKYYDINSSYPASMTHMMPTGELNEFVGRPPARVLEKHIGFAEVWIDYPESNIPALPVRWQGKLIFPVGRLYGVWDYEEIRRAIRDGARVIKWGKSYWFDERLLFGEMVADLYRYRDKSRLEYDAGLAAVSKLMLNSLYGKFGMRPQRKRIGVLEEGENFPAGAEPVGGIDSKIYYLEEETDAPYIIPQISAHITTLSRVRLWEGMQNVEKQGYNVHYCDTDAILCDGDASVQCSTQLGGWKDEYPEHFLHGEFLGPKMYLIESDDDSPVKQIQKVVAKGFNREHRNVETLQQLRKGKEIYFDRLEKVGTLARAGFKRGPRMVETHRSVRATSSKRTFVDGVSIPLDVNMW